MAIGGFLKELVSPITDLVGKAVVDKDKVREIEYKIEELADKADERLHEQLMGQIEINKEEAKHSSIFVAGWRPFIGWVGGVGLGYAAILKPLMDWTARVSGYTGELPIFDTSLLMPVLLGILGLGGYRTLEKKWNVARKSMKE